MIIWADFSFGLLPVSPFWELFLSFQTIGVCLPRALPKLASNCWSCSAFSLRRSWYLKHMSRPHPDWRSQVCIACCEHPYTASICNQIWCSSCLWCTMQDLQIYFQQELRGCTWLSTAFCFASSSSRFCNFMASMRRWARTDDWGKELGTGDLLSTGLFPLSEPSLPGVGLRWWDWLEGEPRAPLACPKLQAHSCEVWWRHITILKDFHFPAKRKALLCDAWMHQKVRKEGCFPHAVDRMFKSPVKKLNFHA